jgi:hypothetical protein
MSGKGSGRDYRLACVSPGIGTAGGSAMAFLAPVVIGRSAGSSTGIRLHRRRVCGPSGRWT